MIADLLALWEGHLRTHTGSLESATLESATVDSATVESETVDSETLASTPMADEWHSLFELSLGSGTDALLVLRELTPPPTPPHPSMTPPAPALTHSDPLRPPP